MSQSLYVGGASAAHKNLSNLFTKGLFSPPAITAELIGVALLIAIVLIDWPAVIDKPRPVGGPARPARPTTDRLRLLRDQ